MHPFNFHWISLIFIDSYCFSLILIDFHWISLIFIDFHWFSLIYWISLIFIDFHWFSLNFIDFHWFSLIFFDFHRKSESRQLTLKSGPLRAQVLPVLKIAFSAQNSVGFLRESIGFQNKIEMDFDGRNFRKSEENLRFSLIFIEFHWISD